MSNIADIPAEYAAYACEADEDDCHPTGVMFETNGCGCCSERCSLPPAEAVPHLERLIQQSEAETTHLTQLLVLMKQRRKRGT